MPMISFLLAWRLILATALPDGTTNIPKNSNRRIPPFVKNLEEVVGTQPRPVFGNIDYQSVIKRTVETQSKKVHVSTPMLKLHLIINDLRNPPWPHPASSTSSSRQLPVSAQPARANRHTPPHRPLINSATIRTLSLNAVGCPGTVMKR